MIAATPVEEFGGKAPPPGTLVKDGERYIYYPDPPASVAPKPRGHRHVMRIVYWTLSGPLRVYIECAYCIRGHSAEPNPRLRKIPEGFTQASWIKFIAAGERRLEEMRARQETR